MKIAFFTDTYEPQINGVTTTLNNFTEKLRSRGHIVYIIAPRIKGYTDKDPQVFRLPSLKVLDSEPEALLPAPVPSRVYQKILRLNIDLVHAHGNGGFSLVGYQIAKIKRIPFILTFHNDHTKYTHYVLNGKLITPKMVERGLRIFGNLCDGVITPSPKMEKELVKYGVKKTIKIIPNFVDYKKFLVTDKSYLFKQLNLPKDAQIIISVGRIVKEKNFKFVIKVFAELRKKRKNIELVLVGKGPEKIQLEKLAKKLGVESHVHFLGSVDNSLMPEIYASSVVFLFPSISEVHPLVILEAAASGLPLVVSDDLAYKNVVEDNVNGFVNSVDETKFVLATDKLLGDQKLASEFGKNSQKIIRENFSADSITDDLVEYYEDIIKHYSKFAPTRRLVGLINRVALSRLVKATEVINKFINY